MKKLFILSTLFVLLNAYSQAKASDLNNNFIADSSPRLKIELTIRAFTCKFLSYWGLNK